MRKARVKMWCYRIGYLAITSAFAIGLFVLAQYATTL